VNVERTKQGVSNNKSQSYQFYVRKDNEDKRVCKKALCSLYQIGKKKIELLQDKMKAGISAPPPDRMG
jgi:ribosomal protein L23